MVTTCAAALAGIGSGWADWTTSKDSPVSASTGGHRSRCHAKLSSRTGIRRSMADVPGIPPGPRRSFHEAENRTRRSGAADDEAARAETSSCTYSPTPVRCRSAGR